MENAVEALKIAAGVLLFVLALTVSISCFSQANRAVTSIVNMRDRDTQILYDQIKPSSELTRTVGVETIVPTMYKAFSENIDIQFKDQNGNEIPIYYEWTQNLKDGCYTRYKDNNGEEVKISLISEGQDSRLDLNSEKILDIILYGKKSATEKGTETYKYNNIHCYDNGFYEYLKDKMFEEQLGEYYPIDTTNSGSTSTQTKKRVVTYKLKGTVNNF